LIIREPDDNRRGPKAAMGEKMKVAEKSRDSPQDRKKLSKGSIKCSGKTEKDQGGNKGSTILGESGRDAVIGFVVK